jgi:hypothetical protein
MKSSIISCTGMENSQGKPYPHESDSIVALADPPLHIPNARSSETVSRVFHVLSPSLP